MTIERLPLPEKVTVGLWNPEKALLSQPQTRTLIDLFYCVDTLPTKPIIRVRQPQSFVFLAQEFGVIDTQYEFKDGEDPDPMSADMAEDFYGCLGGIIQEDRLNGTFSLSSKYRELIETIGGPVTVHNREIVQKLIELAKKEKLIPLGAYMWLKKEGVNLEGWYNSDQKASMAALEKELRDLQEAKK